MVFLNLPETREERLRREVREDTLREAEKRHREDTTAANARSAAWYARMKEAQENDEPFDEPPPWEQQARMR